MRAPPLLYVHAACLLPAPPLSVLGSLLTSFNVFLLHPFCREFRPLLASVATMGSSNKLLDVSMGSLLPSRSELSLSGTRKVSKRGSFLTKWKWASLKSATERSENSRPDKKSLETVSMLIARRRTSVSSMRRPSSFFRFTTVKSTDSLNSQDFGCRAPSQQRGTDLTRCQSGVGRFEDIERVRR